MLSDEQQAALVHDAKETLVVAAAGSGKTRLLIERLFRGLEQSGSGDIVAITFTERAAEEMRERAKTRAKKLSRKMQREFAARVRITTIDGFCLSMLSEYPLFVAPPGRRLLPEGDDHAFVDENVWDVLHELPGKDAMLGIRAQALEGLVRSLFDKRRLRTHVDEKTATAEVQKLIVLERERLFSTCKDALAVMEQHAPTRGEALALQACLVDFAAAPGTAVERACELVKGRKWSSEARFVRDAVKRHVSSLQAFARASSTMHSTLFSLAWRACDELQHRYDVWKRQRDAFDFVDLGLSALRLCEDPVAGADIAVRISHLLIDEVQDTNPLQERLLSVWGRNAQVFRVGDPRQAIYGFRDAEVEAILEKAASLPPSDRFSLTRNHRSLPPIIHLANAVLEATRSQVGSDAMSAARSDGELLIPRVMLAQGEGKRIALQVAATVQLIKNRIAAHRKTKDIAVLCRRRNHVNRLHEQLQQAGIACSVRTKRDLSELPATHDALALLSALEQPDNDALIFAAMRTGGFGASIAEVALVAAARAGTSALTALMQTELSTRASKGRDAFSKALVSHGRRQAVLARFLEDAGVPLTGYLPVLDVLSGCDDLDLDMDGLSRRVLAAKVEEIAGDDDGVQLLTQHGAKGLEWPCVIVPFIGEPPGEAREQPIVALPSGAIGILDGPEDLDPAGAALRIANERRQLGEELRLFYVAMTRARDELWFVAKATKKMSELDPNRITNPLQALRSVHDYSLPPDGEPMVLGAFEVQLMPA